MTAPGLDSATVTRLEGVALPGYDRDRTEAGIVHLGLGAFARAHIATYLDDTLARDPGPWAITGVSLRSPGQRDRLVPQDGLYTAIERQDEGMRARIVGAVRDVLVAPENPAAVVGRLAAPQTRIVSLTITEKGYCHDPATGALVASHPDIRHDLENAAAPRTAVGLVTAALQARRLAGQAPRVATPFPCAERGARRHCWRTQVCVRPIRLMPMKPRTLSCLPSSAIDILHL